MSNIAWRSRRNSDPKMEQVEVCHPDDSNQWKSWTAIDEPIFEKVAEGETTQDDPQEEVDTHGKQYACHAQCNIAIHVQNNYGTRHSNESIDRWRAPVDESQCRIIQSWWIDPIDCILYYIFNTERKHPRPAETRNVRMGQGVFRLVGACVNVYYWDASLSSKGTFGYDGSNFYRIDWKWIIVFYFFYRCVWLLRWLLDLMSTGRTGPLGGIDGFDVFSFRQSPFVGTETTLGKFVNALVGRRAAGLDHVQDSSFVGCQADDLSGNTATQGDMFSQGLACQIKIIIIM